MFRKYVENKWTHYEPCGTPVDKPNQSLYLYLTLQR